MEGKRVLIIGATVVSIVTARELASMGAEAILACRDTGKTAEALKVIALKARLPPINLVELSSSQCKIGRVKFSRALRQSRRPDNNVRIP